MSSSSSLLSAGSVANLDFEKEKTLKGLRERLVDGAVWDVIAESWFEKWRQYMDSGGDKDLHPGPIDNSSLRGASDDELSKEIIEGKDFSLFPDHVGDYLFKCYGGSLRFQRSVFNVGSVANPVPKIALYPVMLNLYLCDADTPNPDKADGKKFIQRMFPSQYDLRQTVLRASQWFHCDSLSVQTRCWVRNNPQVEKHFMVIKKSNKESSDTSEPKRTRVGRLLTSDETDVVNTWRYIRSVPLVSIQQLADSSRTLDVIIECAPQNARPLDWPRGKLLERWKDELQKDDLVDAIDNQQKWYEAVVLGVTETGSIKVHFRSWSDRFNEEISENKRYSSIQPLFTYSENRYQWDVGSEVSVRLEYDTGSTWVEGVIQKVDFEDHKVLAKFKERTKSIGAISTVVAKETEKWFDLLSEDICPFSVHGKKPTAGGNHHSASAAAAAAAATNPLSSSSASSISLLRPSYDRYEYGDRNTRGTPVVEGVVGLQNLGNTCFMNSILQCLSNTQPITELFLNGSYVQHLNRSNPLGHGGRLAETYAKLIRDMWSGHYLRLAPREFKTTIGEFQPQFAGYDQQDSQEFMGFLLDGLHEDLNKIVKKPHVTKIESKGRPDDLISSESWRRYLLRNDSELVETCFGQLKSHVKCTNCGNVSVTFDEYSSISLPIPIKSTKLVPILLRLMDNSLPIVQIEMEVDMNASMESFRTNLLLKLLEIRVLTLPTAVWAEFESILSASNGPSESESVVQSQRFFGDDDMESDETATTEQDRRKLVAVDSREVNDGAAAVRGVEGSRGGVSSEGNDEAVDASPGSPSEAQDEDNMAVATTPTSSSASTPVAAHSPPAAACGSHSSSQDRVEWDRTRRKEAQSKFLELIRASFHLHFCTSFTQRPHCIHKTIKDDDLDTPFQSIVGRNEILVVFQLEHHVPLPRQSHHTAGGRMGVGSYRALGGAVATNGVAVGGVVSSQSSPNLPLSASASTLLSLSNMSTSDDPGSRLSPNMRLQTAVVDVLVGAKNRFMLLYDRIDLVSYPMRISYVKDITTNQQLHEKLWLRMKRFIRSSSPYANSTSDNRPYDLHYSVSGGTTVKDKVEANERPFELMHNTDCIMVVWKGEVRNESEHYIEQQEKYLKTIDYSSLVQLSHHLRDLALASSAPPVSTAQRLAASQGLSAGLTSFNESSDDEDSPGVVGSTNVAMSERPIYHLLHRLKLVPSALNNSLNGSQQQRTITIYDCLDKFIEREQLAPTETLYCSNCKQHLPPIKKMDIWASPDILILHLKRFQYTPGQYFVQREKINHLIEFPIDELDLSRYVIGPKNDAAPPIYDLYGVSHHSGGLGGGHYTATCKNFRNNQWYNFNDSMVTESSPKNAVSTTAYVLFYKRRTGKLRWGGIVPTSQPEPDE